MAVDARAVVLFGGGAGLGRELVAGVSFVPHAGAATTGFTNDGIATSFGTGAADNEIRTAESLSLWAVTGDLTCAWRGFVGDTGTGGGMIANGNNAAINSPSVFSHDALYFGGNLFRAGPSGFRRWERAGGSTRYLDYDATLTKSVSHGADISVAPSFYFHGVYIGAASSADGSGSGVASGGPFPLRAGFNMFSGNPWHTSNIAIIAARQWSAEEHLLFHLDPYGVIEEAPRYYYGGVSAGAYSLAVDPLAYEYGASAVGLSSARRISVDPLAYTYGAQDVGLSYRQGAHTLDVEPLAYTYGAASVGLTFSGAAAPAAGPSRTRRGARKIYLPEPQATAVFHPNALPEELATHAVKAWQDDEDDETWFLLA